MTSYLSFFPFFFFFVTCRGYIGSPRNDPSINHGALARVCVYVYIHIYSLPGAKLLFARRFLSTSTPTCVRPPNPQLPQLLPKSCHLFYEHELSTLFFTSNIKTVVRIYSERERERERERDSLAGDKRCVLRLTRPPPWLSWRDEEREKERKKKREGKDRCYSRDVDGRDRTDATSLLRRL